MAAKPLPDADLLRQLLRYEPDTGKLFWRERNASHFPPSKHAGTYARTFNRELAGKEAFTARNELGYHQGWFINRLYRAHRLIWKIVTGEDPDLVDHINGDASDNRWFNLREVSRRENGLNRPLPANNTSGVLGVRLDKRSQKWMASIKVNGIDKHLGTFADIEEARAVRMKAEREFGYHPNHGRRPVA